MLNSLVKSQRFVQDIIRYNTAIELTAEPALKAELSRMVNELVSKVKKIDEMHSELIYTKQIPSTGKDFRDDIHLLRKKIENKIKENSLLRKV